jgi:hypothetical protein
VVERRAAALKDAATVSAPKDEDAQRREANLVTAIRGMSEKQRAALRVDADEEVFAAILRNHCVALGMSQPEWEHFRVLWQRRKYPDLQPTLERLNTVGGYAARALPVLDGYIERQFKKLGGLTAEYASDRRRA